MGSTGAVRSRAWIWDFSSTHSTTARSGGSSYRPTTSRTLPMNWGSSIVSRCPAGVAAGRTPPDPGDRGLRQADLGGQRAGRPVRGVLRSALQGCGDHPFHLGVGDRPGPAGPRLVQQTFEPVGNRLRHSSPCYGRFPVTRRSARSARRRRRRRARPAIATRSQRVRLSTRRTPRPRQQLFSLVVSEHDRYCCRQRHPATIPTDNDLTTHTTSMS